MVRPVHDSGLSVTPLWHPQYSGQPRFCTRKYGSYTNHRQAKELHKNLKDVFFRIELIFTTT